MVLVDKKGFLGLRGSMVILFQRESGEARQKRFTVKRFRGIMGGYQQSTLCLSSKYVELQNHEQLPAIHDVFEH